MGVAGDKLIKEISRGIIHEMELVFIVKRRSYQHQGTHQAGLVDQNDR
jgi:hypothetical protein